MLRFRPEAVGPPAGVAPALLREAARRYAADRPSIAFQVERDGARRFIALPLRAA